MLSSSQKSNNDIKGNNLSKQDKIKSLKDSLIIQASIWNSFSEDVRGSSGLELYKNLLNNNEPDKKSYYQNNTILNIEENITTRSTQESEEKATYLYKSVIKMIENHLNDKEHPIQYLIQYYLVYFIGKVENDNQLRENPSEDSIKIFIEDLKNFLNIIRNCIYIFYNFSELSFKIKNTFNIAVSLFTFDNLTNFFMSYFFYKFEIYDMLFDLISKVDKQKEQLLEKNFKILKNWSPADFGVSAPYTLDFATYNYLKKKYKIKLPFLNNSEEFSENEENKLIEDDDIVPEKKYSFPPKNNDKTENFQSDKTERTSQIKRDETMIKSSNFIPYYKAIEKLKIFGELKSPLHQLKILNETFDKIINSLSEFYQRFSVNFDKFIESDDLISIVLYVISQSQLPNLLTHIRIIENFITQNYLFNLIGYQFVTLKVCLNYIENISEIENRKDQNYSVSLLRESILIDIKKEAESHQEKKTILI